MEALFDSLLPGKTSVSIPNFDKISCYFSSEMLLFCDFTIFCPRIYMFHIYVPLHMPFHSVFHSIFGSIPFHVPLQGFSNGHYYKLTYWDNFKYLEGYIYEKFFYHLKILGWSSDFCAIDDLPHAHWDEIEFRTTKVGISEKKER